MVDRREPKINKVRFDKTISLGTIISTIVLALTILNATGRVITTVRVAIIRSEIMWAHFVREHKDITADEFIQSR
jgi:hypothetical protein